MSLRLRSQPRHRLVPVVVAVVVLCVQGTASATPGSPAQEDASDTEGAAGALDLGVDVASAEPADVVAAAGDVAANVSDNLQRLNDAEAAVDAAVVRLADADGAILDTELRIEELVIRSDEVVVEAFVSPPAIEVVDTLTMDDPTEAAVKQGVLDIQADRDAHVLTELQGERDQLEG